MGHQSKRVGTALWTGTALLIAASLGGPVQAQADDVVKRPVTVHHPRGPRATPVRTAEHPLTIRRRVARPVDVVASPSFVYEVPQHSWNDPRLYYFGPFRTGGDVFYGDVAGNPITRGNAQLGQIAGYGPANGGFGGPHFDAVGGFHDSPGPDAGIDADYASGSLSRPDYGDVTPHYASVKARVDSLDRGVVPRDASFMASTDRLTGRRLVAEGRSNASFEEAKARFAAPMAHSDPNEGLPGDQPLPSFGDF